MYGMRMFASIDVCIYSGFSACRGWDPASGLGSPRFMNISLYDNNIDRGGNQVRDAEGNGYRYDESGDGHSDGKKDHGNSDDDREDEGVDEGEGGREGEGEFDSGVGQGLGYYLLRGSNASLSAMPYSPALLRGLLQGTIKHFPLAGCQPAVPPPSLYVVMALALLGTCTVLVSAFMLVYVRRKRERWRREDWGGEGRREGRGRGQGENADVHRYGGEGSVERGAGADADGEADADAGAEAEAEAGDGGVDSGFDYIAMHDFTYGGHISNGGDDHGLLTDGVGGSGGNGSRLFQGEGFGL